MRLSRNMNSSTQTSNNMPEPGQNEPVLSVSEVNDLVNDLLDDTFPPVWIEGEITGFTAHRSGHWYFTIKDENAQLSCTMFRGANRLLKDEFDNGNQVLIKCKLAIYPQRGQFQGRVTHMEHAGEGKLRREFEELKNRLQEEGLFDDEIKVPIPKYPKCIAIISSPEGAAIRDMYANIGRRYPVVKVVLVPAQVQGASAPVSVADAISLVSRLNPAPDTLIVTRGGGSLEDLAAFNDERVARAIVACPIPVISAVGHETDFTIADFASDLRAPTPSTAAEIATPDKDELRALVVGRENLLLERAQRILQFATQRLDGTRRQLSSPELTVKWHRERLANLQRQLELQVRTTSTANTSKFNAMRGLLLRASPIRLILDQERSLVNFRNRMTNPKRQLHDRELTIANARTRLVSLTEGIVGGHLLRVRHLEQLMQRANPLPRVETSRKSIGQIHQRLMKSVSQHIANSGDAIVQLARTLHAVSPLATLDRGFAVVTKPDKSEWGQVISSTSQVKSGDLIRAHISDGEIDSVVQESRTKKR